jgi:hypothetical protein
LLLQGIQAVPEELARIQGRHHDADSWRRQLLILRQPSSRIRAPAEAVTGFSGTGAEHRARIGYYGESLVSIVERSRPQDRARA